MSLFFRNVEEFVTYSSLYFNKNDLENNAFYFTYWLYGAFRSTIIGHRNVM